MVEPLNFMLTTRKPTSTDNSRDVKATACNAKRHLADVILEFYCFRRSTLNDPRL